MDGNIPENKVRLSCFRCIRDDFDDQQDNQSPTIRSTTILPPDINQAATGKLEHPVFSDAFDMTACKIVFDTAELVENIIVHLPAKQIFGVQRVCSTFATVIAASPSIQEKVFKRVRGKLGDQILGVSIHHTLTGGSSCRVASSARDAAKRLSTVASPLLTIFEMLVNFGCVFRYQPLKPGPENMVVRLEWLHGARNMPFHFDNESYLDTYFCDPPCRMVTVHHRYTIYKDDINGIPRIQSQTDRGLTIRDVLAKALTADDQDVYEYKIKRNKRFTTMAAAIGSLEHESGYTDGSRTVCYGPTFKLLGNLDSTNREDLVRQQFPANYGCVQHCRR